MSTTNNADNVSITASNADQIPVASRINVALIPKAALALDNLTAHLGYTKTDIINRAVQLYWFVEDQSKHGGELLVRHRGGEVEKVRLL